jgi:WD40 repeat protein
LQQWVQDEARSVEIYRQLLRDAQQAVEGRPLREWDVPAILRESRRWSEAWAERYGGGYAQAMAHLKFSNEFYEERKAATDREAEEKRQVEERRRRDEAERKHRAELERVRKKFWRAVTVCTCFVLAGIVSLVVYFWVNKTRFEAINQTSAFYELTRMANDPLIPDERRISAALGGALLAERGGGELDVERQIPLNTWELFGSLKGEEVWRNEAGSHDAKGSFRDASSLALDPRGRYVALANGQGIRIWALPATSGAGAHATLEDPKEPIWSDTFDDAGFVRFSEDGKRLLALGRGAIRYVVVGDSRSQFKAHPPLPAELGPSERIIGVSFIENSDELVYMTTAGRLFVRGSSSQGGPTELTVELAGKPDDLAYALFSPNGRFLFLSFSDRACQLVDVRQPQNGRLSPIQKAEFFTSAVFSDDSRQLVIASEGGQVELHSTDGARSPFAFQKVDTAVRAVTVTNDRRVAVGTSSGQVYVLLSQADLGPQQDQPRTLTQSSDNAPSGSLPITWLRFASEGDSLVVIRGNNATVFDVRRQTRTMQLSHDQPIVFASFTKPVAIVSASQDGSIRLTRPRRSRFRTSTWHTDRCTPTASAVSVRGDWAIPCNRKVALYTSSSLDDKSGAIINGAQGTVTTMVFSGDGNHLAWLENNQLGYALYLATRPKSGSQWRVTNLELTGIQLGQGARPPLLAFSDDGGWATVALPTPDDTKWDIRVLRRNQVGDDITLQLAHVIQATGSVSSLAVNAKGAVAVGTISPRPNESSGLIRYYKHADGVWNASDLKPFDASSGPTAIAFLPNHEDRLLVALTDGTVWVVGGQLPERLQDGGATVRAFYWNLRGETVAAAAGGNVKFFSLRDGTYRPTLSLRESGNIQSLAFPEENVIVSSVAIDGGVVRDRRSIQLTSLIGELCDNLPLETQPLPRIMERLWSSQNLTLPTDVCGEMSKKRNVNVKGVT